jgi:hypothetical protein
METPSFLITDIKDTFFEEVLNAKLLSIDSPVLMDDEKIGMATILELKCFYYFLVNYYPDKYATSPFSANDKIISATRASTVLGFMRLLISDRLKLENKRIHRIWIREGGVIVIDSESIQ